MQHLYVLRRFSSWSFRLSASVALLLSSAGLAAGLLVSTTVEPVRRSPFSWRPTPAAAQAASKLTAVQPVTALASALPVSLSSMVPAYSLTASPAAPRLASYIPTAPAASPEAAPAPAADALRTTVQRSWNTFKLAFR